jgi:hypothetical protein
MKKLILIFIPILAFAGCSPTTHEIGYASQNAVEIKYEACAMTPTLTAQATDMAAQHCGKYGKFANYQGASVPNIFASLEVHTFACEDVQRDNAAIIQADKGNYNASTALLIDTMDTVVPTQTVCTGTITGSVCSTY